ncbi:MAG: sugar phosphate isomerase/epimerase [Kiritimatiellia bacterium]|nr:sugar phosphate isomerase/epimerase [Kiritimatiellia bacterium]
MMPSIWTGMYAELPLHNALRLLHESGWRAFEISTEHLVAIETAQDPHRLAEVAKDCLEELELSAPQAHLLLQADVAAADTQERERNIKRLLRHMEISALMNAKQAVIHPGGRNSDPGSRRDGLLKLNIESFRRLGDFAGEHAMRIGIENMPWPGFAKPSELLELLQRIDHPAIGITLDTSHANMCSLNVSDMVLAFGPHLVATHISDNNGSGDQHLTPGGGTIDWPAVMKAFRKIDYKGIFNLEIPGERHAVLGLRKLKTRYALDVATWLIEITDLKKEFLPPHATSWGQVSAARLPDT